MYQIDDPDAAAVSVIGEEQKESTEASTATEINTVFVTKGKEESEEDSYNEEYYDEQGKYIWGKEGEDWEFYDQEDKECYEKGLSIISNTLNP